MERWPVGLVQERSAAAWVCWCLAALGCLAAPLTLTASPPEMATADRLAILYAPQFNFTRDGEPLVHVGVLSKVDSVEFSADGPLRVVVPGASQSEVLLDGRRSVRVSMKDGKAGRYRHWVVVGRVRHGDKAAVDRVIDEWVDRGYLATAHEVGALFAVGGRPFDSRVVLIGLGGYDTWKEAMELARRLEQRFGIETEHHTELLEHASGTLTLSGGGRRGAALSFKDVLWVAPQEPGQVFTIKSPGGKRRYAGHLAFTADRQGRLAVVNAVPIETLVKGVVPSEVYTSAPMESLKAQAVAARGHVLGAVGVRHLADPYLKCSEVHCQVYSGLSREHPRTNKAVEETRGVAMFEAGSLSGDWRIVDARYSSSCGGHTEHNDLVWGGQPMDYLRGNMDLRGATPAAFREGIGESNIKRWLSRDVKAWCNTDSYGGKRTFRWERDISAAEVQKKLDGIRDIGRLKDVRVVARGVSGRVVRLAVEGEFGALELDRELAIRRFFGGLRSSMFVMNIKRDAEGFPLHFSFEGGGFGHGAGMCQTGAMMMGRKGRTYDQILHHYYKNIALKTLY